MEIKAKANKICGLLSVNVTSKGPDRWAITLMINLGCYDGFLWDLDDLYVQLGKIS